MKQSLKENARLLTIYIGEADRWRNKPLYAAILETLKLEKFAGATVTRGVAGFGAHSIIHTAAILRLSEDLPLSIQIVDTPREIDRAIEIINPMVREGLITVQDIKVIKYTHRHLNPLPADRLVQEVMTREVETLTPQMGVGDAWRKMLATLIKAMPVVDEHNRVVGMLTDEDLLERAGLNQRLSVAERLDEPLLKEETIRLEASSLSVGDVMSQPAITVKASDSLGLAAARMARAGIKRLPVVDEDGGLVGVLSRVDILRLAAEKELKPQPVPLGAAVRVREVMLANLPVVSEDAGLAEIVEVMLEGGAHRVVVLDSNGKAAGLISDSDLVARVQPSARGGLLKSLRGLGSTPDSRVRAAELMSPGVLMADPDTSINEAVRMMFEAKRKWLVVAGPDGKPLGLVDRQILLRTLADR